jgi:hypothetical protein
VTRFHSVSVPTIKPCHVNCGQRRSRSGRPQDGTQEGANPGSPTQTPSSGRPQRDNADSVLTHMEEKALASVSMNAASSNKQIVAAEASYRDRLAVRPSTCEVNRINRRSNVQSSSCAGVLPILRSFWFSRSRALQMPPSSLPIIATKTIHPRSDRHIIQGIFAALVQTRSSAARPV